MFSHVFRYIFSTYFKALLTHLKHRDRKIFHLLLYSLNGNQSLSWARLKQEPQNAIHDSHVGHQYWGTWAIICCLPRYISREMDWRWSSWDQQWCPFRTVNTVQGGLTRYTTTSAPLQAFKHSKTQSNKTEKPAVSQWESILTQLIFFKIKHTWAQRDGASG